MQLLDHIETQLISNRLPLVAVTLAAVPYANTPVVLTLPLFFAGLIFSSGLERAEDIGSVLSANILGAMLGGFLEYNSMYWGFSSLYPLGLTLYALALVCTERARKAGRAAGAARQAA